MLKPVLTAEVARDNPKLQGLLETRTAVVLNIEYASLESSYESVVVESKLPLIECSRAVKFYALIFFFVNHDWDCVR